VAIALVGGSKVVFLDEPTTGLDPVSKRQLWSIISAAKEGRSIILTTHDLFEAEVLSQRIGMMALGQLKALGSALHLKNKFAVGFRLVVDFKANVAEFIEERLKSLLVGSKLELTNSFHTSKEYRLIPDNIAHVFELMSTQSVEIGISAFTIGNLGIESVFERVFFESHNDAAYGGGGDDNYDDDELSTNNNSNNFNINGPEVVVQ
jgi:ABC-type multidrug transport system ATPase subunit